MTFYATQLLVCTAALFHLTCGTPNPTSVNEPQPRPVAAPEEELKPGSDAVDTPPVEVGIPVNASQRTLEQEEKQDEEPTEEPGPPVLDPASAPTRTLNLDDAKLRPVAPPEDALRRTPDSTGRVSMLLDLGESPSTEPLSVTLRPFWSTSETQFDFKLMGPGAADDGNSARIQFDQPLVLMAPGIPPGQVAWGIIEVKQGEASDPTPLALVIGNFGPTVGDGPPLAIPTSGRARLAIDVRQHRKFGPTARFELTAFTSGSDSKSLRIFDPGREGLPAQSVELAISPVLDTLWLEVDALPLIPGVEYYGALQTTIGEHSFIDTAFVLKRVDWKASGAFADIDPVRGRLPLEFSVRASTPDKSLEGLFVASASTESEGIDPRKDLVYTLDDLPLWRIDASDKEDVKRRSISLNGQQQIKVSLAEGVILPPGAHEITLRMGALNVAPENWPESKITMVVRHSPWWAVVTLVLAVLFSFTITKGIGTAVRRRNLRLRISKIRKISWLNKDRWGALPIVRAFGRIALADCAMAEKHGLALGKALSRLVTTPQLIADEVTEVETRLEVLKRLNELAIYWHAAPSATGVRVSGMEATVINRAKKILRQIVDRFGQLQDGEAVTPLIMSEIEALEGWEKRELLEAGYWANLRSDIQLLLDGVQLDQFDFDVQTTLRLGELLQNWLATAVDDAQRLARLGALEACKSAATEGLEPVRQALSSAEPEPPVSDEIEEALGQLATCDRETVRRLAQDIDLSGAPGTLNKMIQMEATYARLKLIWEQREYDQRRTRLLAGVNNGASTESLLSELDDEVWALLKGQAGTPNQQSAVRIVLPTQHGDIEAYSPADFRVECTNRQANTFLFKHGLEYEWTMEWSGNGRLTATTRSTTVTQFIPVAAEVSIRVIVRRGDDQFEVVGKRFTTVESTRFHHLWPTGVPELLGIGIALVLALVVGFQSDAFTNALEGSWREYLALIPWGIAADQTKNLIQNVDRFAKGEGLSPD